MDIPLNPYIPRELLEMLKLPYGYSLLVKGEGGVGKSTLALELLVQARNSKNTYISTRISPEQLFEHFPWVDEEVKGNIAVLDATQAGVTMDNPLDTDQIALKFSGMPDLLRKIIEIAESGGQHFFVIDSWDAVQLLFEYQNQTRSGLSKPELTENLNFMYNAFMSLVREYKIKMILVAENVSAMDYLVDGIVELKRVFLPEVNKMVREIELKKFRGLRINNNKYLFSLEKGRFKIFPHWDVNLMIDFYKKPSLLLFKEDNIRNIFHNIINQTNTCVGSVVVDTRHLEVMDQWIENLARLQVFRNQLFTCIPPDNFNIPAFKNKVLSYMKEKGIEESRYYKNIKIYTFNNLVNEENVINLPFDQDSLLDEKNVIEVIDRLIEYFQKFIKDGQFTHAINFTNYLTLKSRVREVTGNSRIVYTVYNKVIRIPHSIFIMGVHNNEERLEDLRKISDFYVDIFFENGTPLVNMIAPQTPYLYGLLQEIVENKKKSKLNFEVYPIV